MKTGRLHITKYLFLLAIILPGPSCKKGSHEKTESQKPELQEKCGVLLTTPVLDSFVFPTYYITATVAFPEGNEIIHFHDNVTGDHDGSWYLPRYSKDSTFCVAP